MNDAAQQRCLTPKSLIPLAIGTPDRLLAPVPLVSPHGRNWPVAQRPCSSLISSSDAHSCVATCPVPLLQSPSRRLAIGATHDTSAQEAREETAEDDEPINAHVGPHTPSPWFDGVRIDADVVFPATVARLRVLSRRREQQHKGLTGDHQILSGGVGPENPSQP